MNTANLTITVNGQTHTIATDSRLLLLEVIRDGLGLHGTHEGCLTGDCGVCTVELDGAIVKSCTVLALSADGGQVVTVEGLGQAEPDSALKEAFRDRNAFQCGYCLPGMLFSARALLARSRQPDEGEIRKAISGNLCRCTGYESFVRAIESASQNLREREPETSS